MSAYLLMYNLSSDHREQETNIRWNYLRYLRYLKITISGVLAHSYTFSRVPFDWMPKALARCRKWWRPVQEALVCRHDSSQAMSWFLRGPSRCPGNTNILWRLVWAFCACVSCVGFECVGRMLDELVFGVLHLGIVFYKPVALGELCESRYCIYMYTL